MGLNICLVSVPNLKLLDPKFDPPLGLMYLASTLEHAGYEVAIKNLCFHKRSEWVNVLGGYDVYGFTVYTPIVHELAWLIKELKRPHTRFIAGGPHATSLPQQTLELGFDTVIQGEGELVLTEILQSATRGIIKAEKIRDLDTLPFPARHLIPLRRFHRRIAGVQSTGIISARGCPYHCAFCSKDVHGGLRLRSPANVTKEIAEVYVEYGFKALHFYDDTFTCRPFSQLRVICNTLKRLGIVYRCTGDLRRDDIRTLKLLSDTDCKQYCVGVESGSQAVLDAMNKGTTVKRNKEVMRLAKKLGLPLKAYFMVGGPGETKETVQETINFIDETRPDESSVFSFVPYPDCDIFKNPDKYHVKIRSVNFQDYCMVYGRRQANFLVETEKLKPEEIAMLYAEVKKHVDGKN